MWAVQLAVLLRVDDYHWGPVLAVVFESTWCNSLLDLCLQRDVPGSLRRTASA